MTTITADDQTFDTPVSYEEARRTKGLAVFEEDGILGLLNGTDQRVDFHTVDASEPVAQYEYLDDDGDWLSLRDIGLPNGVVHAPRDDRAYLEPGEFLPIMPLSGLHHLAPPTEERKRIARAILNQSFDRDVWGRPEFDTLFKRFGDHGAPSGATGEGRDHAWTQRYWHLANGGAPPLGFFRNFAVRSGDGYSREEYNLLLWCIIKYLYFGEREQDWIWIIRIAISSLADGIEHRPHAVNSSGKSRAMWWRYPKGSDDIGGDLDAAVEKFWTEQWQLLYVLWPHPLLRKVLDAYYEECATELPLDGHNEGGMRVRHHILREQGAAARWGANGARLDQTVLADSVELAREDPDRDWPNRLGITSPWGVLPANSFQAQLVREGVLAPSAMGDILACAENVLEKSLVRVGGRLRALYRYKPVGHPEVKPGHPATHLAFCLPALRLLADAGVPRYVGLKEEAVDTIAEWIASAPGMYAGSEGPGHLKACAMVAHSVVRY